MPKPSEPRKYLPRRPRLRLNPREYQELVRQVLRRDGWRCQRCGQMTNLQVHHKIPRARLGDDNEINLVTLCENCHRAAHQQSGLGPVKSKIRFAGKPRR